MKEHHYFSWLDYEQDHLQEDHPDAPDLADKSGNIVIVPREDGRGGDHELVLLKDSYWKEEDGDRVVAYNNRGFEVAVAHRS